MTGGRRGLLARCLSLVLGLVCVLAAVQNCRPSQAATPTTQTDFDNTSRTSLSTVRSLRPTRRAPDPACPRLRDELRRFMAQYEADPASPHMVPYVENGKAKLILQTDASDEYLGMGYDADVVFRSPIDRYVSVRAPVAQLCNLSNDPAIVQIALDEPVRIVPPPKP